MTKIDDGFSLFSCVVYRLPGTAVLSLNITDPEIGSVHHFAIANLKGGFWVCLGGGLGDLHIGVVIEEGFLIMTIFRRRIRQHQHKGTIIAPVMFLQTNHCRRNSLVKFTVAPDQKIHVLVLIHQRSDLLLQQQRYLKRTVELPMPEKSDGKNI